MVDTVPYSGQAPSYDHSERVLFQAAENFQIHIIFVCLFVCLSFRVPLLVLSRAAHIHHIIQLTLLFKSDSSI